MKKNKIIFLDIDGVLNVIPNGYDEYGGIFHDNFVDNLRWIIQETNAKIVISSTWKSDGLTNLQKMWKKRNLPGEVIDITPTEMDVIKSGKYIETLGEYIDLVTRGHEIQQWIDDNNIDTYCIIDDDNDMLSSQSKNFVRTSNNPEHSDSVDIGYGLTKECSKQVIDILLNKKIDIYFAGSIRGGREDAKIYFDIIKHLKNYGNVFTEHIGNVNMTQMGENMNEKNIHDRDIQWINESNIIVAEVTQPSIGVGYEIGIGIERDKKVLCLFRKNGDKMLSGMIEGNDKIDKIKYVDIGQLKNDIDDYFNNLL